MSEVDLNIHPYHSHFLTSHETETEEVENDQIISLDQLLQKADLVSEMELKIALEDQEISGLPLEQILVEKGWLKQQTIDFFLLKWEEMREKVKQGEAKYKIGECLKEAGLICENQLQELISLQKDENMIFGKLAIEKGFVKETTINFFIKHLGFYREKSFDLQAEETLKSVRKLVFLKNYDLAILELRKALKIYPYHAGLNALLGIVYIKTKQIGMAKVFVHKAQRLEENAPLVKEASSLLEIYQHTWTPSTTSLDDKFNSKVTAPSPPTLWQVKSSERKSNFWQKLLDQLQQLIPFTKNN